MSRHLRARTRSDRDPEAGITIIETVVASALLLLVLATLLGALSSVTEASVYASDRSESLDQLRLMAANLGKDVRQASRVTTATQTEITLDTLVAGAPRTVTWRVTSGRLTRTAGADTQVYVIDLSDEEVFSYNGETTPSLITRVRVALATQPDPRRPAVVVETETEMRNA